MTNFNLRKLTIAAVCATSFWGVTANAATSDTMGVTATVSGSCSITATDLAFGSYDAVSANAATDLDVTTTLSVTCTSGTTGTVTLTEGTNADTTGGSTSADPVRRMTDGSTNYLNYELYTDSGRTTEWSTDTATTGETIDTAGDGTAKSLTVYGRIPAGQTSVPAGGYTDTVTAEVTF